MGILNSFRTVTAATSTFPAMADVIMEAQNNPVVYSTGYAYYDPIGYVSATRDQAMSLSAVARCRNIIAGTLASIPLELYSSKGEELPRPRWMKQPDPNSTRGATLAWTIDDLIFHGNAYWQIIDVYKEDGRPSAFRFIPYSRVTPNYNFNSTLVVGYSVDGATVPNSGLNSLITFQALDEGVLKRGATTIKTAQSLEQAARRSAEEPIPSGTLRNTGMDLPEEQVLSLLSKWKTARSTRATAYLTSNLEFKAEQFDNSQQQLVESRKAMQTMLAQMMNVPPYLIGAESGSSMTYNNAEGEKRFLVDFSLRNYITPIEQRLSMDDITIMGQYVEFDLDDFLRGNPAERAAFYRDVVPLGILTVDEARDLEDLAPSNSPVTPPQTGVPINGN